MFGIKSRKETTAKKTNGLSEAEANAVLDILINHSLATEFDRKLFVELQTYGDINECGLMGSKFHGTKFHVFPGLSRQWTVSTYNDYLRDNEQKVVNEVNAELAELRASFRG